MAGPIAPAQVAAAYRAATGPVAGPVEGAGVAEGGFGAAMQRAFEGAVEVGRSADAATSRSMLGQGSVTDVVLAVSRAELALQTAVAVRDRVVSAYQDVMRMPI
jgi:flagellar hook-basal body complex protein FliE